MRNIGKPQDDLTANLLASAQYRDHVLSFA